MNLLERCTDTIVYTLGCFAAPLLFCVTLALSVGVFHGVRTRFEEYEPIVLAVESAGIEIPWSGRDIQVCVEPECHRIVLIRFTMKRTELDEFLEESGFVNELNEEYWPFEGDEFQFQPRWWLDEPPLDFAGVVDQREGICRRMLVHFDQPDSVRVVIYVAAQFGDRGSTGDNVQQQALVARTDDDCSDTKRLPRRSQ